MSQFTHNVQGRVFAFENKHLGKVYPSYVIYSPLHICPANICPYQQYLSFYCPDLDQTLNKGSWEYLQQITIVTTTFVQASFVLGTFVHISNISAVTAPIWIKL